MEDEQDVERARERQHRADTIARLAPDGLRVGSPLTEGQEQVVGRVMDCAFAVHRILGPGFRERVYHRALGLELDSQGLKFEAEKMIEVRFREWLIPGQRLDLLVEGFVLVEAKAVPKLLSLHRAQVISYLKTLDLHIGLLINFNVPLLKDGFKRVVR